MNLWAKFTMLFVGFNIVFHVFMIIVAVIGGFFDLKAMLRSIDQTEIDEKDDGRVMEG